MSNVPDHWGLDDEADYWDVGDGAAIVLVLFGVVMGALSMAGIAWAFGWWA